MKISCALTALALCIATAAQADDHQTERALQAHIGFLASDAMKGREAGRSEYDIAAQYVAARFLELGLKPAGDKGGFLQAVPLVSSHLADKGQLVLRGKSGDVPLEPLTEFIANPSFRSASITLDTPMVFAGFGVVAPGYGRDDYKGLDVAGKIVVLLHGAPKAISGEERAHYGNVSTKMLAAEARGAIGVILVETPTRAKVRPFAEVAKHWDNHAMVWRQSDGTGFQMGAQSPALATVSLKGAEKLFASWPGGAATVMKAAEMPKAPVKTGDLRMKAVLSINSKIEPAESSNVAGLIEGSDPALAKQVVVLSGHLDHVGIGPEVKGDTIYNGAMDNASGIASMIEVARGMMDGASKPKRSILFLAVTAEEKGLVGADYYARHPTLPKDSIIANVNLDMPVLTYDFQDVVAFGADRSTIGPVASAAAATLGVKVSPDPDPDQGIFTRSDHYRFVQQGIPAVFLSTGETGPGKDARSVFFRDHYHKPSDETALINWTAAVKFVRLNLAIAQALADAPERPRWNKGDFFGRLYKGIGAE